MANQTIEELRDFVNEQMPSNSELLVLPFRTFFFRILNFLAEVPEGSSVNQFIYNVFGTQDVNQINLQQSLGTDFTGDNLIAYLNYLPNKLSIKHFNTLTSLQQTILSDGETLRILKFSQNGPTKLYVRDIVNNGWTPVGGLTPEDSALIFGSLDDLYSKHNLQETAISNKLNKPTTGNNNTYVILGDNTTASIDSINTNIFKNDGTTTGDRVLTLGGVFTVNINGKTWTFSGLSDKSADASFNLMLAINSAGQVAKSNGVQMLLNASDIMTDTQVDAWRVNMRKSGETYSFGQPRVDYISPPVIKNENYLQHIVLRGLNLFLDTSTGTSSFVKIVNTSTNVEYSVDTISVLQNDPTYLSFAINFSTFPLGFYKIKIYNHISNTYNIDTTMFEIRSNLDYIPIPILTWEKYVKPGISSDPADNTTDNSAYYNTPDGVNDLTPLVAYKSSEVLSASIMGSDFWMTLGIIRTAYNGGYDGGYNVGLVNTSATNTLTPNFFLGTSYNLGGSLSFIPTGLAAGTALSVNNKFHIIKRANQITLIYLSGITVNTTVFTVLDFTPKSIALIGKGGIPSWGNDSDVKVVVESLIQL